MAPQFDNITEFAFPRAALSSDARTLPLQKQMNISFDCNRSACRFSDHNKGQRRAEELKKRFLAVPACMPFNVNIIAKKKNAIIRSRRGNTKTWSELNDSARNYWRFFMQPCLCDALKIIIMYIISKASSIYTMRGTKKN